MNDIVDRSISTGFSIQIPYIHSMLARLDSMLRRTLDVGLALFGLIILGPFFVIIAILIKRDTPGPIFFRGSRMGKNGRVFKILKFRTMHETPQSYLGPKVTANDDPRITRIGRVLRDTKINELPQLWNVFIGDMSLVGPRPEDPKIAQEWPEDVRREVLSVRPGITSPASVIYRHEEILLQSTNMMNQYLRDILPSKLRLDQLYIRNRTILTDIDIIFWTLVVLLPRLKWFSVPEHLLFWGPLSLFFDRFFVWFITDTFVSFISISVAGVIWRIGGPLDLGEFLALRIAFAIALLFSLFNFFLGFNRINWSRARASDVSALLFSSSLVTSVLFVLNLLRPGGHLLPPAMIVVAGGFTFMGFVAVRYRMRLLTGAANRWMELRSHSMGVMGERVLIIGAGDAGYFASWILKSGSFPQAFRIIGMIDDNPRLIGMRVDGYEVIGRTKDVPSLVTKYDVGLILYAISNISEAEQDRILSILQNTGARVVMVPDIIDTLRAYFPESNEARTRWMNRAVRCITTDRVTNAYNRNHFASILEREFIRARRYHHPLSVILISIKTMKQPGSENPKPSGAQVMKAVAQACHHSIREIDILGRLEGHNFAILLPETDNDAATQVAARLEKMLRSSEIFIESGQDSINVCLATVSASDEFEDAKSLMDYAQVAVQRG